MRSSLLLVQLIAIRHASCTTPQTNPAQPELQHPKDASKEQLETEPTDAAVLQQMKPLMPSLGDLSSAQNQEFSDHRRIVVNALEGLSRNKNVSLEKFNEIVSVEIKAHKSSPGQHEDGELLGVYDLMKKLDGMKLFKALSENVKVQDNTLFVKSMAKVAQQNGFAFKWFPFSEVASRLIKELKGVPSVDGLHKTLKEISALCEEKCQEIKDTKEADEGFIDSFMRSEFLKAKLPALLKTLEDQAKVCYEDLEKSTVESKEDHQYIAECCIQMVRSMVESIVHINSYRLRKYEIPAFGKSMGILPRQHSTQKKLSEVAIGMFMLMVGRNEKYYRDLESRTETSWWSGTTVSKPNTMNTDIGEMERSVIIKSIKTIERKVDALEKDPSATGLQEIENDVEGLKEQLRNAQTGPMHDSIDGDLTAKINAINGRLQRIEVSGAKTSNAQSQPIVSVDLEEKMSTFMMILLCILFVSFLCLAIYTLVKASKI